MRWRGPATALAVALATGALGAGCASVDVSGSGWTKPGSGVQQITLDEMDCVRAAWAVGHSPDLILGGVFDVARLAIDGAREQGAYARCMTERGYRQAAARSELTPGITSSRIPII